MKITAIAIALLGSCAFTSIVHAQDSSPASTTPAAGTTTEADPTADTGQSGTMGSSQAETADTASPPTNAVMVAMDEDEAPVPSLNLMAGQVDGMAVVGADGNDIGQVDNVLGDQKGVATAITVEVGGFLGLGEKTVILMLDDVSLDMGKLKTNLTKDQIENLPDFAG